MSAGLHLGTAGRSHRLEARCLSRQKRDACFITRGFLFLLGGKSMPAGRQTGRLKRTKATGTVELAEVRQDRAGAAKWQSPTACHSPLQVAECSDLELFSADLYEICRTM